MKKQIFPKEFLENTNEAHQFRHSKKSKRIYVGILFLICGVLFSLPFINVDLYTSVRGIIKTQQERIPLRITQSGQVVFTRLQPHRSVSKGDTLLKIAHPILDEKKNLLRVKLKEHQIFIEDLRQLTQETNPKIQGLKTANYKKQRALFLQGEEELQTRLHQATSSLDSRSEQYIQKTIQQLRNEKKTIVLIAHRFSTVVQADEVMVLKRKS